MGYMGAQIRRRITLVRNRSNRVKEEYDNFPNNSGSGGSRIPTITGTGTQHPNRFSHSIAPAPTFTNPVSRSDIDVLNELLSELQRLEDKYMPDVHIQDSNIWQLLRRRIRFRLKGKCKLSKILNELSNLNHALGTHQQSIQAGIRGTPPPPPVDTCGQFTHMTLNNTSNITSPIHHNCNQSSLSPSTASTTFFELNGENVDQP